MHGFVEIRCMSVRSVRRYVHAPIRVMDRQRILQWATRSVTVSNPDPVSHAER